MSVDDKPRVDFDHHTQEYVDHRDEILADLRGRCPVGWSERHGGYWVLSGYDEIWSALRDHGSFSSHRTQDENGVWHGGDTIPDSQLPPFLPLECDPPEWNIYRRLLNPWLAPGQVEARRARLKRISAELLNAVIERGSFDLIHDYANPIPGLMTLDLTGVTTDDWVRWAEPHHAVLYAPVGSDEHTSAVNGIMWQREQLKLEMAARRESPRDDMLTGLVQAEVDGRQLDDEEIAGLLMTVIGGGVDTTTATVANGLFYLYQHREARDWLLADLDRRLVPACEEIFRVFPPVLALARTVTHDMEFNGVAMAAGERVLNSVASANRDSSVFADPDRVDLERENNRHITFGIGIHRCVGSHAAREMVHTMIGDVLRRMPDYEIDVKAATRYGPESTVDGWINMPVTFTPGPRVELP